MSGDSKRAGRKSGPAPPGLLSRLDNFLDGLRDSGFEIGVSQHFAVRRLVLELAARRRLPETVSGLASFVGPVVCHSPREQEEFRTRFRVWAEGAAVRNTLGVTFEEEPSDEVEPEPGRPWWSWLRGPVAATAFVILVAATVFFLLRGSGQTSGEGPVTDPSAPGQWPPGTGGLSESRPESDSGPWPLWLALGLAAAAPGWIAYEWLMWRRTRSFLVRRVSPRALTVKRIRVSGRRATVADEAEIARTARVLRMRRHVPSRDLDVQATVEATAEAGGWPIPRYATRRVSPEYLALVDRESSLDHQASYVDEHLDGLVREGVFVDRMYFDRDPRLLQTGGEEARPAFLQDLAGAYGGHGLWLFSDGAGLLDPFTGRPATWISHFDAWEERSLLTLSGRSVWGYREEVIGEAGIRVLPADGEGLRATVRSIEADEEPALADTGPEAGFPPLLPASITGDAAPWLGPESPVDDDGVEWLLVELGMYLGEEGMDWLRALAFYPEIRWELTLYLGSHLSGSDRSPLLTDDRLRRLVRLPWLRAGYLPDWLRERLVDSASPGLLAGTRRLLESLLTLRTRPRSEGIDLEVAWEKDGARTADRPVDRVFLSSMDSRLSVRLPREAARRLEREREEEAQRLGSGRIRRARRFAWVAFVLGVLAAGAVWLPWQGSADSPARIEPRNSSGQEGGGRSPVESPPERKPEETDTDKEGAPNEREEVDTSQDKKKKPVKKIPELVEDPKIDTKIDPKVVPIPEDDRAKEPGPGGGADDGEKPRDVEGRPGDGLDTTESTDPRPEQYGIKPVPDGEEPLSGVEATPLAGIVLGLAAAGAFLSLLGAARILPVGRFALYALGCYGSGAVLTLMSALLAGFGATRTGLWLTFAALDLAAVQAYLALRVSPKVRPEQRRRAGARTSLTPLPILVTWAVPFLIIGAIALLKWGRSGGLTGTWPVDNYFWLSVWWLLVALRRPFERREGGYRRAIGDAVGILVVIAFAESVERELPDIRWQDLALVVGIALPFGLLLQFAAPRLGRWLPGPAAVFGVVAHAAALVMPDRWLHALMVRAHAGRRVRPGRPFLDALLSAALVGVSVGALARGDLRASPETPILLLYLGVALAAQPGTRIRAPYLRLLVEFAVLALGIALVSWFGHLSLGAADAISELETVVSYLLAIWFSASIGRVLLGLGIRNRESGLRSAILTVAGIANGFLPDRIVWRARRWLRRRRAVRNWRGGVVGTPAIDYRWRRPRSRRERLLAHLGSLALLGTATALCAIQRELTPVSLPLLILVTILYYPSAVNFCLAAARPERRAGFLALMSLGAAAWYVFWMVSTLWTIGVRDLVAWGEILGPTLGSAGLTFAVAWAIRRFRSRRRPGATKSVAAS